MQLVGVEDVEVGDVGVARGRRCVGLVVQRVGVRGLEVDNVGVDEGVAVDEGVGVDEKALICRGVCAEVPQPTPTG